MTTAEVAKASGLGHRRVRTLSSLSSWDGVTISDADAFMRGCGVTIDTLWRQSAYLRRSLDLTKTRRPLAFTLGARQSAPDPASLVEAAIGRRRRS